MKFEKTKKNFLAIEDPKFYSYRDSRFVIQQAPYEHTSSYLAGSSKGPEAIIKASHYVELYDEELDQETYKLLGICTLPPMDFKGKIDVKAVDHIEANTQKLLNDFKFVVSLGAEHTVSLGFIRPFKKLYKNLTVLQLDAHSDLRIAYQDNPYSHASVMARVHELGVNLVQVGIRAQCKEEADLIKKSKKITTFYAHQIKASAKWIDQVVAACTDDVYITIDADGFDPSVIPAVGTAEPNGLTWNEGIELLKKVIAKKNVVGFDVVECAPAKGTILSEYTLAKLTYKIMGYITKSWADKIISIKK